MKTLLATVTLLAASALPLAARAEGYIMVGSGRPAPAIWVEPVYRAVQERVYVPAEYRTAWIELDGRLVQARITVHEGYYALAERLVCVTPGYWTVAPCPIYPVEPSIVTRDGSSVGVQGYARGTDSSEHGTFSPTYEWPK